MEYLFLPKSTVFASRPLLGPRPLNSKERRGVQLLPVKSPRSVKGWPRCSMDVSLGGSDSYNYDLSIKRCQLKDVEDIQSLSLTLLITFKEKMNSETALSAARRECNRLRRQNDYLGECCRLQNEEIERLQRELHKNEEALAERDEVYRRIRELNGLLRSDDNNPAAVFSRLN